MKSAHKLAIAAAVLIGGWSAANYGLALYHDPARSNPDKSIVLLTTSWCPYCSVLRNSLQQSGVPFRELDIETSQQGRWAFRASGAHGIPVTLIGQRYVSGGLGPQLQAIRAAGYPLALAIPDSVRQRLQPRRQ